MAARAHPDVPKELDRYLIPSEQIIFEIRRHKILLAEPFLSTVLAFVLALMVDNWLNGSAPVLRNIMYGLALVVLARFVYKWTDWYRELFLATDRRLMLVYGIFTRKVAIMPMSKVTDMRYDRTIPGQVFGYGKYILESAGQDQALSVINFVPDPDRHYQEISAVIFGSGAGRDSRTGMVSSGSGGALPVNEPENLWWNRK
ncbi:PH domain-containing protein [Spongisporangium articulatum]|uniref:PH domain-containing protein n=1 Tax=Spongisporangium articulatum TaxID=3362603 RepID=A0ABW8AIN1_9ACTN